MSHRKKNKKRLAKAARPTSARDLVAPSSAESSPAKSSPPAEPQAPLDQKWVFFAWLVLIPFTLWAYWPTLVWMEDQWRHEPDYSHGYLVVPLALSLLYIRRDTMPKRSSQIAWGGLSLLLVAIALRVLGRFAYMDFLDGWTLVPWVAGLVWIFAGRQALYWAAPAVVFLILLVPMPFRAESLLSFKLQGLATGLSTASLQTMGLPAIPEGNTIWLEDEQLMVEEACSGLRIFMGMAALGFYFAVLSRRSWVDRVVILAAALPIAVFVNVFRVTGTGLAHYWLSGPAAGQVHDFLGVAMILLGAVSMAAVKWYWENLYRPLPVTVIRHQLAQAT